MQSPCSWGALYFPAHWDELLSYLNLRIGKREQGALASLFGMRHHATWKGNKEDISIPRSRTNQWHSSWERFHYELLYMRGLYLVYPNFDNQESLSTYHMDEKERNSEEHEAVRSNPAVSVYHVPLLTDRKWLTLTRLGKISSFPVLDLFGKPWLHEASLRQLLEGIATGADLNTTTMPNISEPKISLNEVCTKYPRAITGFFKDTSTFTLMISTHSRFKLLARQLSYFSASPLISTIIVTWHHMKIAPPPMSRIRGTQVMRVRACAHAVLVHMYGCGSRPAQIISMTSPDNSRPKTDPVREPAQ